MNKIKKKKTIEHIVKKEIKPNAKIQSHEVFYLLLIVVLVSTISIIFQYARTDLVGEAKLAVEEGKFTEVDIGEGVEEAIPVTQSVIEIQDGFNEKLESTKLEKKDEDWADTSISVDEDSKGRSIGSSIVLKNIKSLNEKTEFKVDYLRKPISKIKTQVISYEPQGDEEFTAEVTLAKENLDDIITTIYRCPSEVFDHENMRCEEDDFWQATSIIPTDNKDGTISFTVDSFSASGGGDDGEPLAGPGDYPTLNPGDVIVDQDYVGSESGYYTDFSEGFADLSGSGGTMYIYDGVYREHQQMFKDGHWSIKGMEHTDQTIFTAAREVTEADFTTSPYTNIYRVALADISGLVPTPSADAVNPGDYYLRAGVVDITDGIMLRQVPLSQLIDASGCPPAFAVDDTYLYVYLSPADPTQHELEIMNANDVYPGILQPGDIDGRISFTNMTFRATGMARDGRTFYFFAGGYPSNLPELYFENFVYSMNDMPLIRASFVYNLTLINVTVPPNHNQNRRMPDVDLFNIQSETYDGEERHYVIKDSEFGPHAFIGQLRLKNSASTALVDGVTLITAGQHPHSGIDVRSDTVPPLTPGKLTIRNSIFASWDHTSAELQADPVYCQETQVWGYDGGWRWLADNQDDAVSDFLFSETRTIFDVTLENNLFAYSHFATYLQDANQGSIMQGKNNIFINSPPTFSAIAYGPDNQVEVPYWDYNLYYNTGDDPYTPGVMRIDGTEYSTLPQIQAGWQSYVLGNDNNDQHSMVAAPELTNWMKNDDLVYDFTPSSSSSNVCGAGEGGEDIGPIPCPTGGDVCAGTDVDCGVWPACNNCNFQDICSGTDYLNYYCSGIACDFTTDDCTDCSCTCGGYNEVETGITYCGDGINNDCDSCTDGQEAACGGSELGSCTGGVDDDCDGAPDCSDSDCTGDPACIPGEYVYLYKECEAAERIESPFLPGTSDVPPRFGTGYLVTPAGLPSQGSPVSAKVDLEFDILTSGEYYVWMRIYGPDTDTDSYWAGFDGTYDAVWMTGNEQGIDYTWEQVETDENNEDYSHDLNTGIETLNLDYREAETRCDRILVTDDPNFVPSGTPGYPDCEDNDVDTYLGYDLVDCPIGDDCDDTNGSINPGEVDICDDGIDQDCAGGDLTCQVCSEGAIPDYGCICDGTTYYGEVDGGYCCVTGWQLGVCDSMCPDRPFEGFGAVTVGGEGQTVYHVTSLADSTDTGTLRDALSQGNRYIVFDVEGTITLTSSIEFTDSYITINGSTAPGSGITLTSTSGNYIILFNGANDVIMNDLRFRTANYDAVQIYGGSYNFLIDHCSFTGPNGDGNLDITQSSHDVTVQWSIMGDTEKNQLIRYTPEDISLLHNFYFLSDERSPLLDLQIGSVFDMVNNVIFDWNYSGTKIYNYSDGNLIGNYYLPGPTAIARNRYARAIQIGDGYGEDYNGFIYRSNNVIPPENEPYFVGFTTPTRYSVPYSLTTETGPYQALVEAYNEVGACPRDQTDQDYLTSMLGYLPDCTLDAQITGEACVCDGAPYYDGYCCVGGWQIGDCSGGPTCIDNDGDGYGDPGDASCDNGPATDCDDDNINIWQLLPGYDDYDVDTYYSEVFEQVCSGNSLPAGYSVAQGDDCVDSNPDINPGELDLCDNGVDEDCSDSDLTCQVCSEGAAIPAYGCTCDGTPHYDGYCCVTGWQLGECGGAPVCTLTNAQWSETSVMNNTLVELIVSGVNCDASDVINFTIYEDDGLFPNDIVLTKTDNYDRTTWIALWEPDQLGDPEFYFEAFSLEDSGSVVSSGLLDVTLPSTEEGVYYVDQNAGAFSSDCAENTQILPFQTIQDGVDCLSVPGDQLFVSEGTYAEQVDINVQGTAVDNIIIKAEDGELVTINGGGADCVRLGLYADTSHVVFDGFTVTNCGEGIFLRPEYSVHDVTVKNCEVSNCASPGIRLDSAYSILIDNCTVHDNTASGVGIGGVSYDVLVSNTVTYNNFGTEVDGFAVGDGPYDITFFNCTSYSNTEEGFDSHAPATFDHCIAYDNLGSGFKFGSTYYGSGTYNVFNCIAYDNDAYGIAAGTYSGLVGNIKNCTVANNVFSNIRTGSSGGGTLNIIDTVSYAEDYNALKIEPAVPSVLVLSEDSNDFYHTNTLNAWAISVFNGSSTRGFSDGSIESGTWFAAGLGGGVNTFAQDPLFADEANNNYTPTAGSPLCGNASDGGDIGALPCELGCLGPEDCPGYQPYCFDAQHWGVYLWQCISNECVAVDAFPPSDCDESHMSDVCLNNQIINQEYGCVDDGTPECELVDTLIIENCDDYDRIYCDGLEFKQDDGYCVGWFEQICTVEPTTIQNCDDSLFCTLDSCDAGTGCTNDPLDCSGSDLPEIAECDNNPDNIPQTWDFALAVTSTCDENADECTIGTQTFTHTCDTENCDADCESGNDCSCPNDGCEGVGNTDWYNYSINGSCLDDCTCDNGTGVGEPCEPIVTPDFGMCIGYCEGDEDCSPVYEDFLGICGYAVANAECIDTVCDEGIDIETDCYPYEALPDNSACGDTVEYCSATCGATCEAGNESASGLNYCGADMNVYEIVYECNDTCDYSDTGIETNDWFTENCTHDCPDDACNITSGKWMNYSADLAGCENGACYAQPTFCIQPNATCDTGCGAVCNDSTTHHPEEFYCTSDNTTIMQVVEGCDDDTCDWNDTMEQDFNLPTPCGATGENDICWAGSSVCDHCDDGLDNDGDKCIDTDWECGDAYDIPNNGIDDDCDGLMDEGSANSLICSEISSNVLECTIKLDGRHLQHNEVFVNGEPVQIEVPLMFVGGPFVGTYNFNITNFNWQDVVNISANHSGTMVNVTLNGNNLNWTADFTSSMSLLFEVPAPTFQEHYSNHTNETYFQNFTIRSPNHLYNVNANVTVNGTLTDYALYWQDGLSWVYANSLFDVVLEGETLRFGGFSTSDQLFYADGSFVCDQEWVCTAWSQGTCGVRDCECSCTSNTCLGDASESLTCPTSGGDGDGGDGSSSSGGFYFPRDDNETCAEDWICGSWTPCLMSVQERDCDDLNNCNTSIYLPTLSQDCNLQTIDNQTYNYTGNETDSEPEEPASFVFSWWWLALGVVIAGTGVGLLVYKNFSSRKKLLPYIQKLDQYLTICLQKRMPEEDIVLRLMSSGWDKDLVLKRMKKLK